MLKNDQSYSKRFNKELLNKEKKNLNRIQSNKN